MQSVANNERNKSLEASIERVASEDTQRYIYTRVMPQMQYYSSASKRYKKQYKRWMVVSIVIGALIPVASALADGGAVMKIVIAACGSAVTAVNAYLTLENPKDLWYSSRRSREALLSILHYYLNNAGAFSHLDSQEKKDALLVELCEQEMTKETDNWAALIGA